VIRRTHADAVREFGDGIVVLARGAPASATISATRIEESARAGVLSSGTTVTLGSSMLSGNAFDLDRPVLMDAASSGGANVCSSSGAAGACKASSAGLPLPPALEAKPPPQK
jgi:hypothetical protein